MIFTVVVIACFLWVLWTCAAFVVVNKLFQHYSKKDEYETTKVRIQHADDGLDTLDPKHRVKYGELPWMTFGELKQRVMDGKKAR